MIREKIQGYTHGNLNPPIALMNWKLILDCHILKLLVVFLSLILNQAGDVTLYNNRLAVYKWDPPGLITYPIAD